MTKNCSFSSRVLWCISSKGRVFMILNGILTYRRCFIMNQLYLKELIVSYIDFKNIFQGERTAPRPYRGNATVIYTIWTTQIGDFHSQNTLVYAKIN